ncbi:hemerythrin family protein [Anaeromyxobacter oryzae]|uniref:Bacteriohemerythrin n=1 Tax=Anaeromyxobacter oryzae TaxID=2918170 RepID=A0ABN6MS31_9BACT|nr:hemerythrin family protein [Anaeromyxobacter oryzae]BDG03085.1 bacteriohemerythrin [Anaeromyxobacter oryzae]
MPYIDPSQIPELPLAFMNSDHAEEVRLLEDLGVALDAHRKGGAAQPVLERLALLAVHTREHFLREEQVMRETAFPAYPIHKAEHDRVLAEMDQEARRFREGGDPARLWSYLFEVVPAWFVQHIRTMDHMTARFVAARAAAPSARV